jgi:tRNA U34 5-methylaminomethyl-2-thiouridine-forming methyltransferase MnmC
LKRKIIITDDGSTSLELLDVNEHYHSTFGAIQEAQFVYLKNGLEHFLNKHKSNAISILEMGFGTGLNAFLSFLFADKDQIKTDYVGIEAFPLNADEVLQLNYVQQLKAEAFASVFADFHLIKPNKQIQITPHFKLTLNTNPLEKFEALTQFNIIYFDAFGPDIQPELWTEAVFIKMFQSLKPDGVLVTYSAKGIVRRTMQSVGFKVERIPGPPGKREMLRATKP